MKFPTFFLTILLSSLQLFNCNQQCPKPFKPPEKCFNIEEVEDYAKVAVDLEKYYTKYLELLTKSDFVIRENEPGVDLFLSSQLPEEISKAQLYGNSLINFLEITFHHLSRDYGLNGEEILYCMKNMNLTGEDLGICEVKKEDCYQEMNFQPIDGWCVNQQQKGAKNSPYGRLMKSSYFNAIHEPRLNSHGTQLPSPRIISNALRTLHTPQTYTSNQNLDNDFLLFYMKIVIFDLTRTLKAQTSEGNFGFECCESKGRSKLTNRFSNHHCMPIDVPRNDQNRGEKCMNYIRSLVTHEGCKIDEAKILNSVSHFMDLSFLYTPESSKNAKMNSAKLAVSDLQNSDERIFMLPQLYSIALTWLKFHNLIVDELKRIHTNLDNSDIFYESRRFVIAVYQGIWFNEVLSLILSPKTLVEYQLISSKSCYSNEIDPSILSEFVASTGRFFHNFIHDKYKIHFNDGSIEEIKLRDLLYSNIDEIHPLNLISEMLKTPWNTGKIGNEISNFLFTSESHGLDLRALDIQAERDFGVATYCDAIYHFKMSEGKCIENFQDMEKFISKKDNEFLKYAFLTPCDVDLGVAGALHKSEADFLNEIFNQIFGIQFSRLKCGDPWFYTNALEEDQINLINEFSFSNVLCLIAPEISVQNFAFLTPGLNNSLESCKDQKLDLSEWKLVSESSVNSDQDEIEVIEEDFE